MATYGVVCALLLFIQVATSRYNCYEDPFLDSLAENNTCGVSKFHDNEDLNRIMGGTNATLGEFPWMARLFYRSKNKIEPRCGGSLIHEEYILTAAHCCFAKLSTELVFVRLGEFDTRTDVDCRGRCAPKHKDYQVAAIYPHKDYNPRKFINDICLVKLEEKVDFSDYIHPICLPSQCQIQNNKFENTKLVVAGWGLKDDDDIIPVNVLQKVQLTSLSRNICMTMWPRKYRGESQICAGEFGCGVCFGDSGGPLMYTSSASGHSRMYAVGLLSFSTRCGIRSECRVPSVYTKIATYLPWIARIIFDSTLQHTKVTF